MMQMTSWMRLPQKLSVRNLHLETRDGSRHEMIRERRRSVSSVRDESAQVLGRADDTEQIIKFLLSDDFDNGKFSVISVVGMGGVGKTTLAQVVCELSDIDSLQCRLRDKLKGKKFLVVLDDVWSENDRDWERLKAPFTFGAKGSRVVITTRSQVVSNSMQATWTHNLKGLSKNDCWSLFLSQAFKDDNVNAHPELLKIGEKLMNKCGGLPLAAKALGGLLSSKRQAREWEKILKSPIWDLQGPARNILPALRLSYQHLSAHLKRCFIFCSLFPKDYEFKKEKLVQMWVAHGFILPEEGKKIEDTGSEYFNDLLARSFFQHSRFTQIAELIQYKMHDLVHDLAEFISGDECFQMENGKSQGILQKIRHLSYVVDESKLINFEPFYESKGLRTFFHIQKSNYVDLKAPHEIFERMKFIRVLDLAWINISELPNSIGNLKHLRYLNLSHAKIKELPESICIIYTLQTLILTHCRNLVELPNEMRKLTNLRHLDLEDCKNIVCMPPNMGRLACLQTLPWFVVGRDKERGIAELKGLKDICGKLQIGKLENIAESEDAQQAHLNKKPFINDLQLLWSEDHNPDLHNDRYEEIANGLQPHPNLQKLLFYNYRGANFPNWMMKTDLLMLLSNLVTLHLSYCRKCSILPPLGCLPSLSFLQIKEMDEVKQMGHEVCGMPGSFPSLKQLYLRHMVNLEQWHESEEGDFPCLEKLQICNCPRLTQIPNTLSNLKTLLIVGCSRLTSLPCLPSLKELFLNGLANLEEWCNIGGADFLHLQKLQIHNCPKLTQWPSILPVITELTVLNCQGFETLPLLPSLYKLYVGGPSDGLLKSVPCLASLSSLAIHNMPSLTSMPRGMLQLLTQLKDLKIYHCQHLVTLLEENGLQDEDLPSSLTSLSFIHCPSLQALPRRLHAITSLQKLRIYNCPHVTSLPEGGLPVALQTLNIFKCPVLKERCMNEDWPKISHIRCLKLT